MGLLFREVLYTYFIKFYIFMLIEMFLFDTEIKINVC